MYSIVRSTPLPRRPPKRFVVLTRQRTGSTWLIDLLNSHREVTAYDELFLRNRPDALGRPWGAQGALYFEQYLAQQPFGQWSLTEPLYLLRYTRRTVSCSTERCVAGFKLMYDQLFYARHISLYPWLLWTRARVIHLIRENHLDNLISQVLADRSGIYHLAADEKAPPATLCLNPKNVLRQLRRRAFEVDRARRLLHISRLPHIEVTYEQLLGSPGSTRRLCDFLGVTPIQNELSSGMRKLNPLDQRATVTNLDEIAAVLDDTPFRWMVRR